VKISNLRITLKLGILVGMTLRGLCAAGILAGMLMQREMLNARIEQTKAIVEIARNLARANSTPNWACCAPRSMSS
jgi:methyl-accepting chemotaxis protein